MTPRTSRTAHGFNTHHVCNLAGLLAGMRAREFRVELGAAQGGGALGALQERNRLLEEQVGGVCWRATSSMLQAPRVR